MISEIYNCGRCRYVYYDPNDKEEYEKCHVINMIEKPPINEEVCGMIINGLGGVCEYFDEKLKNEKGMCGL